MKSEWEKTLLEYYKNNFNAKWIKVYQNKHPVLATRVIFYTKFKRIVKHQPYMGELTYANMFYKLKEGAWYDITELLKKHKEE